MGCFPAETSSRLSGCFSVCWMVRDVSEGCAPVGIVRMAEAAVLLMSSHVESDAERTSASPPRG